MPSTVHTKTARLLDAEEFFTGLALEWNGKESQFLLIKHVCVHVCVCVSLSAQNTPSTELLKLRVFPDQCGTKLKF